MSKYDPLRDYLASRPDDVCEFPMSFERIEELVGKLPQTAYLRRGWWSNTADTSVEARAWRSAGWYVKSVDRTTTQVVFARSATDAISKQALIRDFAAAVVAAAAAGVIQLVGLTHLPWLPLILLVAAVAAVASTMTQAVVCIQVPAIPGWLVRSGRVAVGRLACHVAYLGPALVWCRCARFA